MPLLPRILALVVLCAIASFAAHGAEAARVFRAGAATSNVTPPLGSSMNGSFQDRPALQIHDELHARCLVLDDGTKQHAFAVLDHCVIDREVFDDAKRQVHEATGLPLEQMTFSATHTHSSATVTAIGQSQPNPAYRKFVAQRIANGIRRAQNNLAPARIAWGAVDVPQHVFNRRWILKPGTVSPSPLGVTTDQVRTNPGSNNPNLVEPAGPTDPQVSFISLQTTAGRPIALFANYSLHYVGGTGIGHVSADYYGYFADEIQRLLGADRQDPPFVGIMSNGTSGDINNANVRGGAVKQPPYAQMQIVANDVALAVARSCATLRYQEWVPLDVAQTELELGVRLPQPDEVEKARVIMKAAKTFPRMGTMEESYALETVLMSERAPTVSIPLQVIKIGALRIATIPAEAFVQIGLELKRRHPSLFCVSLANGYYGYLPTPEQHRLGGYETWPARSSFLEVDASDKIITALEECYARLK